MSFTNDVKTELCGIRQGAALNLAECYGMLLFCKVFSFNEIKLQTGSKASAERFAYLLRTSFDIFPEIIEGGNKKPCYRVKVVSLADIKKIMYHFGYKPNTKITLEQKFLKTEGSLGAFLRGAFLSCGLVSDPNKEYRMDFSVKFETLANEFKELFADKYINFKITNRGRDYVVYTKKSEEIEDLLTLMGAGGETLNLINVKIYKSLRNKSNRINNFETSNIVKTANTAYIQRTAIEKWEKNGKLKTLPEELYEVAILRLENPDLSLSALSKLSKTKLTRSGFNHRMTKLMEIINKEV